MNEQQSEDNKIGFTIDFTRAKIWVGKEYIMEKAIDQVFNEAADLLEKNGWIQGRFSDDHARYCVSGAIAKVNNISDTSFIMDSRTYQYFRKHINNKDISSYHTVSQWNDVLDRTQEEVIRELREAALSYKHEQLELHRLADDGGIPLD